MSEFRVAHASASEWSAACGQCVDRLGDAANGCALGFVYVTDHWAENLGAIAERLRDATGIADWVGTAGMGVCATGVEYFDQPAMVAMLVPLQADGFRLLPRLRDDLAPARAVLTDWQTPGTATIGFVHADPRNPHLGNLLQGLSQDSIYLLGGISSSRACQAQVCGTASESGGQSGGLSGVLFAPDVGLVTGLSQGCTPIGPPRRVTESRSNVIMQIDDRPALEVFKQDIGELLARDLRRVAGYIFCAFPVAGADTGDYLVRNLVAIDTEHGWIAVAHEVEDGDAIRFCRRDRKAAEQDLRRMLGDLRKRAGNGIRGGLYVSCIARGVNLFGDDSRELGIIRDELGDFPLAGFFANGEICNDRLYGYTGVLTLFV
jgi:small ligand-binding sensory domain FIST